MGGIPVGTAQINIEIGGEAEALAKARAFAKQLSDINKQVAARSTSGSLEDNKTALLLLKREKALKHLAEVAKGTDKDVIVSATEAALKADIAWQQSYLRQIENKRRQVDTQIKEDERAAASAKKAADDALRAQERLGAETAKLFDKVNPGAARQRATDFAKLATGAKATGGPISALTGLLAKAETGLAGFGLTLRDVSVIAGSGLLSGGIALVAKELINLGKAVVEAVIHLGQLGAELDHERELIEGTFGPAAEEIRDFADSVATAFGLTETAALSALGGLGDYFQGLGASKQASADLAEDTLKIAEAIVRTSHNHIKLDEALQKTRQLFNANIEALQDEGIKFSEVEIRAKASEIAHRQLTGALTQAQKVQALHALTLERVNQKLADNGLTTLSLAHNQASLSAALGTVAEKLGTLISPLMERTARDILILVRETELMVKRFKDFLKDHPAIAQAFKVLGGVIEQVAKQLFPILRALDALHFIAGIFKDDVEAADAAAGAFEDVTGAIDELTAGMDAQVDQAHQVADAHLRLARALEDAERNIDNAERNTREALLDGFKKQEEAARDLARGRVEAAEKIQDATRNLRRTELDAARDIKDAQKDVRDAYRDAAEDIKDARKDVARTIRDENERIADADKKVADLRIDIAEKVADAEKKIRDIAEKNAEDIAKAYQKATDALQDLHDAQLDLQDAWLDAADRIAKAQRKVEQLDGTRERFIRSLTRAQREELKRTEALQEAQAELDKARADAAKAIADAQQKVRDAEAKSLEAQKNIIKTQEEPNERLAEAEEELRRIRRDTTQDLIDAENDRLKVIRDSNEKMADAQEKFRRTVRDGNEKIKEAERALVDTERQAKREIEDAKRELTRTVRDENQKVIDLERKKKEVAQEVARSIAAAQRAEEDARRNAKRAIDDATKDYLELGGAAGYAAAQSLLLAQNTDAARIAFQNMLKDPNFVKFLGIAGLNKSAQPVGFGFFPPFMAGGTMPGSGGVVGERGPELFIPGGSGGEVITNERLLQFIRAMEAFLKSNGRGGNTIIVNEVAQDPRATAAAVAARLGSQSIR